MCDRKNMLQQQTQFVMLPNEIIYCVFDFLTNLDILRAFAQLNRRYNDLVRFYIKRIELTENWRWNRQQLQWICETIQILKIDQWHIHLLDKTIGGEGETLSPTMRKFSQRNERFSLRSVIKTMFTRLNCYATPTEYISHRIIPVKFPQLHSLQLVDVYDWTEVVSGLNLKSLSLWFDEGIRHYDEGKSIPETIVRFSTNAVFKASNFHSNLIDLTVCVLSIVDLIEIVEHTANLQHLFVTFSDCFRNHYCVENYQSSRFETMTTNSRSLDNLSRLSFSTKHAKDREGNECLPFDQIQLFIDRCCPNKSILKRVTLKLDHILFSKDMWLTIVRYKNTFERFDFYASFIVKEQVFNIIEIPSTADQFNLHIEGSGSSHPQDAFVHIYSLPFTFDKLDGFISCAELSSRTSFSTVRHLYFTPIRLDRRISFESLTSRMPYLISIDCDFTFTHDYGIAIPEVIVDRDNFNHVRFLRFISHCGFESCVCRNLLSRLLDRMPYLRSLVTSEGNFIHEHRPLPPIKRLNLRHCRFQSFDLLARRLPHLSMLLLDYVGIYPGEITRIVGTLFIGIPSLSFVSFRFGSFCGNDRTPYRKYIEEALPLIQNMDNCLRHLKLDFDCGVAAFYLQNS